MLFARELELTYTKLSSVELLAGGTDALRTTWRLNTAVTAATILHTATLGVWNEGRKEGNVTSKLLLLPYTRHKTPSACYRFQSDCSYSLLQAQNTLRLLPIPVGLLVLACTRHKTPSACYRFQFYLTMHSTHFIYSYIEGRKCFI